MEKHYRCSRKYSHNTNNSNTNHSYSLRFDVSRINLSTKAVIIGFVDVVAAGDETRQLCNTSLVQRTFWLRLSWFKNYTTFELVNPLKINELVRAMPPAKQRNALLANGHLWASLGDTFADANLLFTRKFVPREVPILGTTSQIDRSKNIKTVGHRQARLFVVNVSKRYHTFCRVPLTFCRVPLTFCRVPL